MSSVHLARLTSIEYTCANERIVVHLTYEAFNGAFTFKISVCDRADFEMICRCHRVSPNKHMLFSERLDSLRGAWGTFRFPQPHPFTDTDDNEPNTDTDDNEPNP